VVRHQALIEKFCEAKHPDALALREAMRLAEAAKEIGWSPPPTAPPHNRQPKQNSN
jgi:hypothetical protein